MKTIMALGLILAVPSVGFADPLREKDFSLKETRALVSIYANCVVQYEPRLAWKVVRENPNGETIKKRYSNIYQLGCNHKSKVQVAYMRFSGDTFYYALAEALFRRDLSETPLAGLAAVPALTHRKARAFDLSRIAESGDDATDVLKSRNDQLAAEFLSPYGECIVRAAPEPARKLLQTPASSAYETAGFTLIQPALAQCLPPGTQLKFSKMAIRGAIAFAYVRLADAATPGAYPSAKARPDA